MLYTLLACAAALHGPNTWIRYAQNPHPLPLKQAITQLAADTAGGVTESEADAAEMAELICLLEKAASGAQPSWETRVPLMVGSWDQIYTDNPQAGTVWGNGFKSRRKLKGPISGRVLQLIEHKPPDGFTYAQRARSWFALGLQAEMRASVEAQPDGVTWRLSFDSFGWSLFGGRLRLQPPKALPPGSGGLWRTTYLDHDTRILRSQSSRGGNPTCYVLRKC